MAREASIHKIERSPLHLLHRAGQAAEDAFLTEVRVGDLTARQFAVLLTVGQNEGLSQTNLVDRTGIDRSTLADVVRRMLKKGLLQRRRTREDARAYAVKLTDEGSKLLKSVEAMARRVDDRILACLPAGQRDRFLQDLNTIIAGLSQPSAKGSKP